jgi:hypothetical protein
VRGKTIILVAMLIFLVYGSSMIYIQAQYPGYDQPYNPLIGGIQIEISTSAGVYVGTCSLAFPVQFIESTQTKNGFITAGHCVKIEEGKHHVHQPRIGSNFWDYYIGYAIRNAYPHGGGKSDLDGALINLEICEWFGCYPSRSIAGFIYENGRYYREDDYPDRNNKAGITGYLTPTKNMENNVIVYKSGRTTGLTYGLIIRIDYNWTPSSNIGIYPTILISRCPTNQCYYNDRIADGGDSGGVVYIRYVIYSERIDGFRVYDYGARVIGIVNGVDRQTYTYLVASWAVKVKDKWPELNISFVTCGPDYSSSCR